MAVVNLPTAMAVAPEARANTGAAAIVAKRVGTTLGRAVIALVLVLALWQALVWSWGEELVFSTRGPLDVWRFWIDGANGAVRADIMSNLWITLGHAGLGLLAGTAGALVISFLFSLFKPLEQSLMPVAMVMRSIPLVAMAPLISLVFGRDILTVAIVGAIVTFFPTLVNVNLGLRTAPQQSVDLIKAYGGGRLYTLFRIQFPFALPALFAALRATAPLAITGAMLAEFFLVGNGLGHSINVARNEFDYTSMWAQAAIATLAATLIYAVSVGIEGSVLARFAPDRAAAARTKA